MFVLMDMMAYLSYVYVVCIHNMVNTHILYLYTLPIHLILMIVYDVLCMLTSFTMSISYVFVRIYIYIYIVRRYSPDVGSVEGAYRDSGAIG